MNLSYNAWKGTTFWRKTMLLNKIHFIPREFVSDPIINKSLILTAENFFDKNDPDGNNNELKIINGTVSKIRMKNQIVQ